MPPRLYPGNRRVVLEVGSQVSRKSDFAFCSFDGNVGEGESLSGGTWGQSQRAYVSLNRQGTCQGETPPPVHRGTPDTPCLP